MKYGYYPGCSLERNASAYNISALAIAKPLGVEFQELDDWNCCGATEYISLNKTAAYALVARNLVLAKQQLPQAQPDQAKGAAPVRNLVAPCSACFLNLSKVESYLTENKELRDQTNVALAAGGMHFDPGGLAVRHLLDIFVNDVGYEAIAEKVVKPLKGLRIAPYYGCMIVRPAFQGVFDDPEYPTTLDKLMKVLGASVVDFPMKAQCCGGHMTQLSEAVAMDLIDRILRNAADYEADIIVTLCPMCQLNLDAYQDSVNRYYKKKYHIPVLYFTQMIGLAMGMGASEMGIGKELIDARAALAKIGVEAPQEESPAVGRPAHRRERPSKEALPMPQPLDTTRPEEK